MTGYFLRSCIGLVGCIVFTALPAQKRFRDPITSGVDSTLAIPYGAAVNIKGNSETLLLNVYQLQ